MRPPRAATLPLLRGALVLPLAASCGGSVQTQSAVAIPEPASTEGFDRELVDLIDQRLEAVRTQPDDPLPWLQLGMAYEAHVMLELALPCYERAVALDGTQARWWYRLAVTRAQNGDYQGALGAVARTCEMAADYRPAHLRRGQWLLELGELDRAQQSFERAHSLSGPGLAATLALAQVHLARGEHEAVLTLLPETDLPQGSNGALAHKLRGTALARLGREEQATHELALGSGARLLYPDPWSREVKTYQRGLAMKLLAARRLLRHGKAQEAAGILEELRLQEPENVQVLHRLASAYSLLGRPADTRAALEEAIALKPQDAVLRVSLAWALAMGEDLEAALAQIDTALELDPRCRQAHEGRVRMLLSLGRREEAIEAHRAGLPHGATGPGLAVDVGRAQLELGRLEEALASFEQATRGDPSLTDAWIGVALACKGMGREEQSAAALQRAQALDPDHAMLPGLRSQLPDGPPPRREREVGDG